MTAPYIPPTARARRVKQLLAPSAEDSSLMDVLGVRSLARFKPARPDNTAVRQYAPDTAEQRVSGGWLGNVLDAATSLGLADENTQRAMTPPLTENAMQTERVLRSPAADSLWATMNNTRPPAGTEMPRAASLLGAMFTGRAYDVNDTRVPANYNPYTGAIALPEWAQRNRATLVHEAGHRYDHMNDGLTLFDKRYNFPELSLEEEAALPVRERNARSKVDDYYKTNPIEGYASAFENAYSTLTDLARQRSFDRRGANQVLLEMERTTPGAGEILRELLQKDIFRGHPLSQYVRGEMRGSQGSE